MTARRLPLAAATRRAMRGMRGVGLIDGLIAIAILSFGLVGMARMQGRMVSASTDAQMRTAAVALADQLLNTMLVDNGNAACYTLPQTGPCASPAAITATNAWAARVLSDLPGTVTRAVTLDTGSGRMQVAIEWTSRQDPNDTLRVRMETDAR